MMNGLVGRRRRNRRSGRSEGFGRPAGLKPPRARKRNDWRVGRKLGERSDQGPAYAAGRTDDDRVGRMRGGQSAASLSTVEPRRPR
jgi:hypothetical protein